MATPSEAGWTVRNGQFQQLGAAEHRLLPDSAAAEHRLKGLVYPPRAMMPSNEPPRSSLDRAGYLQPHGGLRGSMSEAEAACRAKYASMTLMQLRRQCEDAWLAAEGNEDDLRERLVDYEKPAGGWPAGAPPGGTPANVGQRRYTVILAAKKRAGFDPTSQDLGIVHVGQVITELESRVNEQGITRVRYSDGWLSVKTGDGRLILEELPPDSGGSMQPTEPQRGWQPPAPAQQPAQPAQQPPHPGTWQSAVPPGGSDAEAACRSKYSSMTVDQLRRQCQDAWMSTDGSVRDLVDRLVDYEKPAGGWPPASSSQQNPSSTRDSSYQSTSAARRYEPEPQIIDRYGENRLNTTPQVADRYGSSATSNNQASGQFNHAPYHQEHGRQSEEDRRREEERRRQDEAWRPQAEPLDWQRRQETQPQRVFSHQQPANERGYLPSSQHVDAFQRQQSGGLSDYNSSAQNAPHHIDLDRELESISRELVEAARQDSGTGFRRLEDQIHQLAKHRKAELLAIKDQRMLKLAGDCVRSAALYALRDAANIRQSQKIVIDEGEASRLKEASMILLAALAENPRLEDDLSHPVGPTQQNALDAAVLVLRGWAGPEGMRKDSTKAAASPWRDGTAQPKVLDNLIRQAVGVLCFTAFIASGRRRQEMSHKKYPDLVGILLEVGRERNARHGSILAFATVAFLTGTRIEPPQSAPANSAYSSRRAGPDGAMIDDLCQAFDQCMRGDDLGLSIESQDSSRPKAEHSHLIAEAVYEMTRTAANARLLLRQDIATRLLLEACMRYRGSHAQQVVHAAARALLCLSLDVRGAQVLDKQGHAVDTLRRVSESREIDEETRLYAERACFALTIRQEAERRALHQPYLTASLSGAPGSGSILVSYTKNDEKKAIALVSGLRVHNFNAQIINANELSKMTGAGLASSIDGCAALLLCCSRSYRESSRCQLEVAYTRARRTALQDIGPAIVPIIVSNGFKSSAAGWLTDLVTGNTGRGGPLNLSDVEIVTAAEQAARAQQVLRSIGTLEMEQLRQVRRADAPPALQLVLDAVVTLLGRKPEQPRDANRGLFADEDLFQQLQNLVLTPALVSAARRFTADPMCTPEAVGKASVAGRLLCEWVRAVTSEFAELLQSLKQLAEPQIVPPQASPQKQPLTIQVPNPAGSVGSVASSLSQIQPMPDSQYEPRTQQQVQMRPHQIRPQPEPQLQQPPHQPSASTQRPTTSVPPPIQHQHLSPVPQTVPHMIGAAALAPRAAPNSALSAMNSAAVEAWLRRKGLAELFPRLQSRQMDHGAALSWISSQLRDPRAEVLLKCEDVLKTELQVPLGVLYQFLYHVEHFTN